VRPPGDLTRTYLGTVTASLPTRKKIQIMMRLIMASVCQICLGQGYVYANGKKLQCACR